MKCLAALLLSVPAVLYAQGSPLACAPNPHLSEVAVDDRGLAALVESTVSPGGQANSASDLYLLSTDGMSVGKLTSLPGYGAFLTDLSADGTRAAYNARSSTPEQEEIHVVDTSSGADLTVSLHAMACVPPLSSCILSCVLTVHLSPDASKVVYSASPEEQPLYVVNADGSGLLHLPIGGAVLAPSPQRVVSANGLLAFTVGSDVYIANLDGSGMRNLTNYSSGLAAANATISEDGGTIAYEELSSRQLYVVHPGGAPQRLSGGPLDWTSPSISADGSLVAFVEAGQVFLQRTDDGSPPVRLTNLNYLTASEVALSGDGSTVLVTAGSAVYQAAGPVMKRLYGPQFVLPGGISSFSGTSPPSPGSLVRVSGWNFLDDAGAFGSIPLPLTLGGVSVELGGQPIPLLSITPTQITAQVPFTIPLGLTTLTVNFGAGKQSTTGTEVLKTAPEVLQYVEPFFTSIYAAAFHAGTGIVADQAHPAAAGEVLEMYGTGLGAVTPVVDAGMPGPSSPPASAIVNPKVTIGSKAATVTFAGLAPGLVGIDQIDAVVPSGLTSGSQPVSWSGNGVSWVIYVH